MNEEEKEKEEGNRQGRRGEEVCVNTGVLYGGTVYTYI